MWVFSHNCIEIYAMKLVRIFVAIFVIGVYLEQKQQRIFQKFCRETIVNKANYLPIQLKNIQLPAYPIQQYELHAVK